MKSKFLLLLAFVVLLSGCSQNSDVPFTFTDANGRQPSSWNKVLKLELAKGFGDIYSYGSSINLFMTNLSGNQIRFPVDYNLRIYDFTGGVKEIKNRETIYGPDYIILPPNKRADRPIGLVSFTPQIQADANHKIRIFVIGEMQNDDPLKTQLVGAYMDIEMHP